MPESAPSTATGNRHSSETCCVNTSLPRLQIQHCCTFPVCLPRAFFSSEALILLVAVRKQIIRVIIIIITLYPCFSATAQLISITWPQIQSPAPSTSLTPTADVSTKSSQPHQWRTLWRIRRCWLEPEISASRSTIPAVETEAKAPTLPLQIPGVRLLLHRLFGIFLKGICLVMVGTALLSY